MLQVLLFSSFFLFVCDEVRSQCYINSGQMTLQISCSFFHTIYIYSKICCILFRVMIALPFV